MDSNFIWLVVPVLVVVAGGVGWHRFHLRRVLTEWSGAARKFGLRPDTGKKHRAAIFAARRAPLSFSGQYAGFEVKVARSGGVLDFSILDVSIGAPSRIPASVGFQRKAYDGTQPYKLALFTGDPGFDSRVSARGPEPILRAIADAPFRATMQRLFSAAWRANVHFGSLSYQAVCKDDSAMIERFVRRGLDLAQAMCLEHADVPSRLAATALSGDLAQIRIAAAEALSELPDAQERARETTLALLDDPDPEVRLRVATLFGAADLDRLLALAEREREPLALVGLLGHLATFAGARLRPVIQMALRSYHDGVLRAAGSAAAATGSTDLALEIARSLEDRLFEVEPETLLSFIRALTVLRDPATEPALVRALTHESEDVQQSVASALGEFGSVAAIEPLLERIKRRVYYETENALLAAVARIQERIGVAKLGALSLAEDSDAIGALSLAEQGNEVGALSLLDDTAETAVRRGTDPAKAIETNK